MLKSLGHVLSLELLHLDIEYPESEKSHQQMK